MFGVGDVFPIFGGIAFGGNAAVVFEQAGHMHEVPSHKGGVAIGEVVVVADWLGAAFHDITIARAGAGLADPAAVGLWRDGVTDVL